MRITVHTDYALRALHFLACFPDRRVTTKEIATRFDISMHHLLKVVNRLGSLGYVEVTRGQGGGVQLRRDPASIGLGQVVRDFEPDLDLVECFSPERDQCVISPACSLKGVLAEAVGSFLDVLDGKTLADVVQPRRRKLRALLEPDEDRESIDR